MFRLIKRFLAYFIDMMVVLIIVQTITSIPFINKDIDKYEDVYNDYLEVTNEYTSFRLDLAHKYEDEELTEEEYEELVSDNETYKSLVDKYYEDGELTSKNYDKLLSKLDTDYEKDYEKIYYKLDKYSICYNVSYLVVTLLYFVGFNVLTNGSTLGKKLVRLRIVNNKDASEKVSLVSYLIRFVMLYQPVYYLARLICINFLGSGNYYDVINVIYSVHSYLEFAILTFMIVRLDGRGLHDLASGTRVALFDRNGNEIESNKRALI